MVVWRGHGVEPAGRRARAHARPARRASSPSTSSSSTTSTTTCGTSPTTTTRTRGPVGGFFGHGLKRRSSRTDRVDASTSSRSISAPPGRRSRCSRSTGPSSTATARRSASASRPGGGAEQRPAEWWAAISARRAACRSDRRRGRELVRGGLGHVAVVGHRADRRATAPCCTTRSSGWTRGRRCDPRVRRRPGAGAGLRPAQAAPVDPAHRGAPSRSGKDPIAHILWLQEHEPESRATTWKYLEPKDWLNFKLTGVAAATYDSIVLHWLTDNRDPDARRLRRRRCSRSPASPRAQLPDLVPATDGGRRAPARRPPRSRAAGRDPGRRWHSRRPVGRDRFGRGRATSKAISTSARRRGSRATCRSRRPTCSTASRRCRRRCPGKYYVADEQESAGACAQLAPRQRALRRRRAAGRPDAGRRLRADRRGRPPGSRRGAGGVIFTPWLNGERTPGRRPHGCAAVGTTSRCAATSCRPGASGARGRRATTHGGCSGRSRSSSAGRSASLNFVGGGAQSDVWCQIMADVLDRPIRQMEHAVHANTRGAALLAAVTLKRLDRRRHRPNRRRSHACSSPIRACRAVYDPMYRRVPCAAQAEQGDLREVEPPWLSSGRALTAAVVHRALGQAVPRRVPDLRPACPRTGVPRAEILAHDGGDARPRAGALGGRLRVRQRVQRRSRAHRVPQRGVRDQLAGQPVARRPVAEHGQVRGRDRRDGGAHAR